MTRPLVNGYLAELAYDNGAVDQNLPFADLKTRSHIHERAIAADDVPDFSQQIRAGLPRIIRVISKQLLYAPLLLFLCGWSSNEGLAPSTSIRIRLLSPSRDCHTTLQRQPWLRAVLTQVVPPELL